jgi:ribose transport system substrate-binding protein
LHINTPACDHRGFVFSTDLIPNLLAPCGVQMSRLFTFAAVVAALLVVTGCGSSGTSTTSGAAGEATTSDGGTPSYAFFTNGVADFWEHAEAGANAAGSDLGVDVTVIMPNNMADQTRKIEDLMVRGTNGIAISPIDPANQVEILNEAAGETNLITHDSDAPQSNRLVYIGMDNYQAGVMCGRTMREALPDGGKVMIFIGRLDCRSARSSASPACCCLTCSCTRNGRSPLRSPPCWECRWPSA